MHQAHSFCRTLPTSNCANCLPISFPGSASLAWPDQKAVYPPCATCPMHSSKCACLLGCAPLAMSAPPRWASHDRLHKMWLSCRHDTDHRRTHRLHAVNACARRNHAEGKQKLRQKATRWKQCTVLRPTWFCTSAQSHLLSSKHAIIFFGDTLPRKTHAGLANTFGNGIIFRMIFTG